MFELYTHQARRVVFYARCEASALGTPKIEPEQLLLGILREDKALASRILGAGETAESIRDQIERKADRGKPFPTSVDIPISNESKRVLAYAAEESRRVGHRHIGPEHLLLGLLREEGSMAAVLLKENGIELEEMRKEVETWPVPPNQ